MLTYKILDSISKIDRTDWDSIFGSPLQGYDFYRAVEESDLEGFSFYYILIYEKESLLLIAPLFTSDFNLCIGLSGIPQKIILAVRKAIPRFLIQKTLFCGSPISENGILGMAKDVLDKKALLYELVNIMEELCRKNHIPLIIFKDFLTQESVLLKPLKEKGFFMVESFPTVVAELNFNSMEDYFASLSRNTKKDLRRKLRKAKAGKCIVVKEADSVEDIIEDVYALYLNTYNAGSVRFEKLTKDFFINVSKFIPQTKFFLYYAQGKLAAFNLCFSYKDTLIDEFIGFDYTTAFKYNLYSFSWCYNIEWCLKNSIKRYQVGQTDYYPKLKLGGRLIPLYAFVRHNSPALNLTLRRLAKLLAPADLDENIKGYRNKCAKTTSH